MIDHGAGRNRLGSDCALFTNTEDFSGRPSVVDGGGYVTYVGQENRQHALGHMVLWGLKEPVMPWCSDGPDEAELGGALDATLSDWADRTHAQGGTVVAAHFPNPNGEPAVLVATGRANAVEMLAHSGDAMLEYYRYLNSGYRSSVARTRCPAPCRSVSIARTRGWTRSSAMRPGAGRCGPAARSFPAGRW